MQRLIQRLCTLTAALLVVTKASAFSLMGPFASWQAASIGYNLPGDIGGPMNLFEGYRITVPVLTFGYDATFLNFFGSNGVVAVQSAMDVLNAIPSADQIVVTNMPRQAVSTIPNATAQGLQIYDLKSAVLSTVLGQMGLASPERWVFTLRDRLVAQNTTNYTVIMRHFDPVTWNPTNRVNDGAVFTYTVVEPLLPGNYAATVNTLVGSPRNIYRTAAGADDSGSIGPGEFFGGLTRDDYGGLKYLLRFSNVKTETLTAGVRLANIYSPYGPALGTNANTNVAVAIARRPGIGKVSFSPIAVDTLLGVAIRAVTNTYVDYYYHPTNFYLTNQTLERVSTIPDVVFTAGDLASLITTGGSQSARLARPTSARWVNQSALNSVVAGTGITSGPGV
ncbi:MAG: hypothetical protein EBY09_10300, partial [Verrucomicrobia bacterium]|nr:hypothetical protein [Verrucomicrobiota bacterium]NDE99604.1 hypothetical protein [Verrucomicrobiota bacterium]